VSKPNCCLLDTPFILNNFFFQILFFGANSQNYFSKIISMTFLKLFYVIFQMASSQVKAYLHHMKGIYASSSKPLTGILSAPEEEEWEDLPDVRFYHPLPKNKLMCPIHEPLLLFDTGRWTDFSNEAYPPRLVYCLKKNFWMISRLYSCPRCDNVYIAHDESLLDQMSESPNFMMYRQSGISVPFYTYIVNSVDTGKN
jgi:hypothetical protein